MGCGTEFCTRGLDAVWPGGAGVGAFPAYLGITPHCGTVDGGCRGGICGGTNGRGRAAGAGSAGSPRRTGQAILECGWSDGPAGGGEWAEVKTLVLGEVQPPELENGEWAVHTRQHSYFSRLADVETFQRLALVKTHRRGVETAGAVAAVTDGSEWIQKFVDHHSYRAVRILDFPHAGEHIHAVGQAHWGEGSAQAQAWLAEQLHDLKHQGPAPVLSAVRRLVGEQPEPGELATHLAYLEKREAHMQYPTFQAAGWPIGDGAVESANKLVVEARLKGSGMHWTREHVDAMLALRNIVCNDRWDEAWPQITTQLRQQAQQRRMARHQQRRPVAPGQPGPAPRPSPTPVPSVASATNNLPSAASPPKSSSGPWRPPADHPWRHMPVGRARFKPPSKQADAKT
jgi:hypothetical protein